MNYLTGALALQASIAPQRPASFLPVAKNSTTAYRKLGRLKPLSSHTALSSACDDEMFYAVGWRDLGISLLNGVGSSSLLYRVSLAAAEREASDVYTQLGIIVTLEGEETFWRSYCQPRPPSEAAWKPSTQFMERDSRWKCDADIQAKIYVLMTLLTAKHEMSLPIFRIPG
ncbi:uncharacterized protein ARMOST_02600 [Armillaria ostoyae]|uniref:Uncharacterized protein n=1 Tax=Armillaria ostoyae TaxID=47428 RepID=A0A284QS83_ARMOS|nr:uncharacterized protein ARMOST_02600 [Armillaria ostoyae]